MNTTKDRQRNQLNGVLLRWAEKSVPLQESLHRMDELLGPVNDRTCLWVVAEDALVGYQLMQRGGRWTCLGVLEKPGMVTESLLGDTLERLANEKFSYPDDSFDVVMMDHVLEYFDDAAAMISECHRVLKPNGYLVVQTQQSKRLSLVKGLRKILGLSRTSADLARSGYTQGEMFELLKDGFDTEEVLTWSRFFVEMVELQTQLFVALSGGGGARLSGQPGDDERMLIEFRKHLKVHSFFYPFGKLAVGLDKLLPLHRGHRMAVRARSRSWKPRVTPTLKDGRSIADATINTKIGTAGPF